eukprot:COSAG02_NODE_56645_length_284_cov_1.113514_1_plen_23_part_01
MVVTLLFALSASIGVISGADAPP